MKLPKELLKNRRNNKLVSKDKKNAIKLHYPIHTIKYECCDRLIPCPSCEQKDLLREWNMNERTLALCYNCGTLFFTDNGEVIEKFVGNRDFWGAMAVAICGSLRNV